MRLTLLKHLNVLALFQFEIDVLVLFGQLKLILNNIRIPINLYDSLTTFRYFYLCTDFP
jgi:hypothetical protein